MEEESNDSSITSASSSIASRRVLASSKIKQEEDHEDDRILQYQRNLDKVLDEYTERYEAQPEKSRKCYDEKFDKKIQKLAEFHRTYGHWKVPARDGYYKGLHQWLTCIHNIYRCAYYEGQCYNNYLFPRYRYEKLKAIGYLFEEIGDGKRKEDLKRCERKLNKVLDHFTKRYDKLSEREQKKYDGLFDTKLKYLIEFHRKFGHWKVPRDESEHIFNWLYGVHQTYKNAYYKGLQGSGLQLPRHRYEKLVVIGYPFDKIPRQPTSTSSSTQDSMPALVYPKEKYENATKESKREIQEKIMSDSKSAKEATATNTSKEEVQSLKTKILQLEKENETQYETIYRLKDEKESLVEKVEEQENQLAKLNVYMKREQSFEHDNDGYSSNSSKKQRTSLESSNTEIERLRQERQLLIDQLTASTENYRTLLALLPKSKI